MFGTTPNAPDRPAPLRLHRDERGTANVQQMLLITLALIVVTVSTKFAHGVITDFDERKQQLEALFNGEEPDEPEAQAMSAEADEEEDEAPWENPPDLEADAFLLRQERLQELYRYTHSMPGLNEARMVAMQLGYGPHFPLRIVEFPPTVRHEVMEELYRRRAMNHPDDFPMVGDEYAGWDHVHFPHQPSARNRAFHEGGAALNKWRDRAIHPYNNPDHPWHPYNNPDHPWYPDVDTTGDHPFND